MADHSLNRSGTKELIIICLRSRFQAVPTRWRKTSQDAIVAVLSVATPWLKATAVKHQPAFVGYLVERRTGGRGNTPHGRAFDVTSSVTAIHGYSNTRGTESSAPPMNLRYSRSNLIGTAA